MTNPHGPITYDSEKTRWVYQETGEDAYPWAAPGQLGPPPTEPQPNPYGQSGPTPLLFDPGPYGRPASVARVSRLQDVFKAVTFILITLTLAVLAAAKYWPSIVREWQKMQDDGKDKGSSGVHLNAPSWFGPALLILAVFAVVCGVILGYIYIRDLKEARLQETQERESRLERLSQKMELPSLVESNRLLLDKYHIIATDQAKKAYHSSRIAMGVGLTILVVAFFAGWRLNAQGDRLFIGSIAAVGSTFTAYLSRTYMQTYERTLQQLNQYFNQPVLNGYFLTAERIAAALPPDRKAELLERVVDDVLESGKEMHRSSTSASKPEQANPPRRPRRRRAAQGDATIPTQQTQ